ncbi:flavonol sulfotransferase-like [Pyrus x bretschneideri]|uniref:flavonol sulfotransferase-like n=1 Tax=Pyrus x bretschneideri TaxID=225117 RepID=UPI00202DF643|nr:flavonol sulfotransferase-like [Pyrus x bretschneideri]
MSSAPTSQPFSKSCQNIVPKTNYIEEKEDGEAYRKIDAEICREMLPNLPKEKGWTSEHLVQYQGIWLTPTYALKAAVQLQHHFNLFQTTGSSTSAARGSSPICFLATIPKSGTTWLRALMFATLNRSLYDAASPHHPLLTTGPHDCFPFLEMENMLGNHVHSRPVTSLDHDHDDRDSGDGMINNYVPPTSTTQLFATHLPYSLLPKSVTTSSSAYCVSKFVYVCRNPKDAFISLWKFGNKVKPVNTGLAPLSMEEAFELFCRGVYPYGPYWDHVLGFWKASLEMPAKVLFLKYEDLRKEPSTNVKRLAEFLGQPFSEEEESKGVVQQIIKLCSFENLSSLEVNKTSRTQQYFVKANIVFENSDFFRKGQVGDWKNFFTDDMVKRMDQIIDERFSGSGLTFANP